jgi:uncharacterized membrane protein YvbJ
MRCSKCGSDNREGRKFCTTCGTSLAASCPKCGAAIAPGERFCGECGTALGEAASATVADIPVETESAAGERRHLTDCFAISWVQQRLLLDSIPKNGARSSPLIVVPQRKP